MLFWIIIGIDALVWAWVVKMELASRKRAKQWAADPRNGKNSRG